MGSSLVWMSGASSGIGGAMAESAPGHGAGVVGVSRVAPRGAGTVDPIGSAG